MATGAVTTPVGPRHSDHALQRGCQSPAGALPSNGTVSGLPTGLNQFKFTGAIWPKHPTQGINLDVLPWRVQRRSSS